VSSRARNVIMGVWLIDRVCENTTRDMCEAERTEMKDDCEEFLASSMAFRTLLNFGRWKKLLDYYKILICTCMGIEKGLCGSRRRMTND